MKKQKRFQKRKAPEPDSSALFSNLLKSFLFSLCLWLVLILLSSLLLYFLKNPNPWIKPTAFAVAALTAFFGGFFFVKKQRGSALVCGLLLATVFTLFTVLLSLFFQKDASGFGTLLSGGLHLGFLILSVLGAFAALPKR